MDESVKRGLVLGICPIAPLAYFVVSDFFADEGVVSIIVLSIVGSAIIAVAAGIITGVIAIFASSWTLFGSGHGYTETRDKDIINLRGDFERVEFDFDVSPEEAEDRAREAFAYTAGFSVFFGFFFAGIAFSVAQIV